MSKEVFTPISVAIFSLIYFLNNLNPREKFSQKPKEKCD
jgi:hypothetical protein